VAPAHGDDDSIASGDTLDSAKTFGSGVASLSTTRLELPVVPLESYVRLDEYARGGLGRIIRARDERNGRIVAIKEMLADDADAAARFVREAMVTANLQHPTIVPVYEVGQWPDGKPFYAMKLVRGRALNDVIDATADLDSRLALISHVAAVADALAYAHEERVIHRDLKPHNVLCGAFGETVVIDWGLARRLDDTEAPAAYGSTTVAPGETSVGAIMGTPSYMPPEQARGERADQQSDVYAIGAILYQVLAGRPPHVGSDLETLLDRVKNAPVEKLPPEVPRDLAAIVERALARDRATRYPSAAELASDLRRFMNGQLVLAHHYTRRQRLARFVSRNRGAVAVAAAALAIVSIVATVAIRNIVIARREATAGHEEARRRLVASYVDRAGLELVNGQPARSLAYTIASAQLLGLTPQTRLMAAHALDQLPPLRWWSGPRGPEAVFAPGSHDLLIPSTEAVVRWNPDTDRVVWRVPGRRYHLQLAGPDTLAFAHDNAVSLISVADGTSIAELPGSAGAHFDGSIAIDPGERWFAAGTADRVDLFDLTTRTLVASIPFANPRPVLVTADGEHLLVEGLSQVMSVIDRSGKVVATFKVERGTVLLAGDELVYLPAVGSNGIEHLAIGDWTGKVRLELPIGSSPINGFAVDVEAKRLALVTEEGGVQVRSLVSGETSWQTLLRDRAGAVLLDGNVLRVASSNTVVGFDVGSGLEVERASMPAAGIGLLASDDHARVEAFVAGVGLAVWASTRDELVPLAPTPAKVTDLALAPNGTVITAGEDGEIHELSDGQSVRRLGSGGAIKTLARLDDGTLITASADGTVVVRDRDGSELRRFTGGVSATPSPDGRQIATATSDGTVAIWDPATGTRVRTLGKIRPVRGIRWSPDGRRVAALTSLGNVSVWNVGGGVVREIPSGNIMAGNIAFSNDGKWLARAGEPADALFALDGGRDRKLLGADRQGAAIVVAFSPDDKTLLVAGVGFLSTWDIATAEPRLRIATDGIITSSAFFDHGTYIIAGGMDRRLHVWNADSGGELLAFTLPAHPRKIVIDRTSARVAVLAGRGALVWTVPAFPGTLDELRERARCGLDVEVVDAHLRPHPIDIGACNRVAW
jgi:WD40 repeat protein/tRNA A-37 threonylcarbamoyl transferase component Bud32